MKRVAIVLLLMWLPGCDFPLLTANEKFGKQNFLSAVSLIELHKVRTNSYPADLTKLMYLGDWDGIWLSGVRYELADDGYNLYVERGWGGKPDLELPVDFKKGLGLRDSNIRWLKD